MKIKTKKQLNLPQLIEWAMENEIKDRMFLSGCYCVGFDRHGYIYFNSGLTIPLDRTFTVEVEEEIDEDTEFEHLIEVTKEEFHIKWSDSSVAGQMMPVSKEFHAYIDGEFKLIWKHEKGLVD
ncbi:hypothetical protein P1A29_02225 [Staphylococcus equorum]|uniref:hypothetical protein n=1 Tax=Staphylococcus equorum TaxID=246432 RepID=UPI002555AEB1|nr:hypothetical protein [Staphylococcus equorum]MDK9859257.1 hypothetical protein [Staphylococcus equorum]